MYKYIHSYKYTKELTANTNCPKFEREPNKICALCDTFCISEFYAETGVLDSRLSIGASQ